MALIFAAPLFSQTNKPALNNKGTYQPNDYATNLIYTGLKPANGDTSDALLIPTEITAGTFYVQVDSIATDDSLKSMVIQGSGDKVHWYNTTITFAGMGNYVAKLQRVTGLLYDKYIRFTFDVVGTQLKTGFKVLFLPRY